MTADSRDLLLPKLKGAPTFLRGAYTQMYLYCFAEPPTLWCKQAAAVAGNSYEGRRNPQLSRYFQSFLLHKCYKKKSVVNPGENPPLILLVQQQQNLALGGSIRTARAPRVHRARTASAPRQVFEQLP